MNWTGGRLQRHSKANANPTFRAQKQHFAKARLQQHNTLPSLSPFRLSEFREPTESRGQPSQEQRTGQKRHRPAYSKDTSTAQSSQENTYAVKGFDVHHTKRRRRCEQSSSQYSLSNHASKKQGFNKRQHSPFNLKDNQSPGSEAYRSAQREKSTFDQVKHDLLRRADWMGLCAARPINMKFASTGELRNFGRRRKADKPNSKRPKKLPSRSHGEKMAGHARHHHRPFGRANDMQMEDASIRMGSNIHQTQTTRMPSQIRRAAPLSFRSGSPESMLLDKEDIAGQRAREVKDSSYLAYFPQRDIAEISGGCSTSAPLVPLNLVRNSKTFDEVKSRSDSIRNDVTSPRSRKPCHAPRRRAANRGLVPNGHTSDPTMAERDIFGSMSLCSRTNGLNHHVGAQDVFMKSHGEQPHRRPSGLSSDYDLVGEEYRNTCLNTSTALDKEEELKRCSEITNAATGFLSSNRPSQSKSPSRSRFTLDIQAANEALVGSRLGSAGQHHRPTADNLNGKLPSHSSSANSCAPAVVATANEMTRSHIGAQGSLVEQLPDYVVSDGPRIGYANDSRFALARSSVSQTELHGSRVEGQIIDVSGHVEYSTSRLRKGRRSRYSRNQNKEAETRTIELDQGADGEADASSHTRSTDNAVLNDKRPRLLWPARVIRSSSARTVENRITTTICELDHPEEQSRDFPLSGTDHSSQYNFMTSKLDDRLVNLSTENYPARAQYNNSTSPFRRAPNFKFSNGPAGSSLDDVSSGSSSHHSGGNMSIQCTYGAGFPPSNATTADVISPPSVFNHPGPSSHFKNQSQGPPLEYDSPSHTIMAELPTTFTANFQRHAKCFPMNYTPTRRVEKQRRQGTTKSDLPFSSWKESRHVETRLKRTEYEMNPVRRGRVPVPVPWPQDFNNAMMGYPPPYFTDQYLNLTQSSRHTYTPATPFVLPPSGHTENPCASSMSTPTSHHTFSKPPKFSHLANPSTPARVNTHRSPLHRRDAKQPQVIPTVESPHFPIPASTAFSTPRPMRKHMLASNTESTLTPVEPFSTPKRPVESVLGHFKRPDRRVVAGW